MRTCLALPGNIKRTSVLAEEGVLTQLREIAKQESSTVAEVTRKALREYVSRQRSKGWRLSLIGIGRGGRINIAERAEELPGKESVN